MPSTKHEWRKSEKGLYLPKSSPEFIDIPEFPFLVIRGQGNPNEEFFGEYIEALYSVSYAVRMSHKQGIAPDGYFEYTVYPLEGVWDLSEKGKREYDGTLNKDELVFELMIRQPGFVTESFMAEAIERTKKKKLNPRLHELEFLTIADGPCVQMMHLGSYDDEAASFEKMEEFCADNQLIRTSKRHREIYITDPRKTAPEKLQTVLRFKAQEAGNSSS